MFDRVNHESDVFQDSQGSVEKVILVDEATFPVHERPDAGVVNQSLAFDHDASCEER